MAVTPVEHMLTLCVLRQLLEHWGRRQAGRHNNQRSQKRHVPSLDWQGEDWIDSKRVSHSAYCVRKDRSQKGGAVCARQRHW